VVEASHLTRSLWEKGCGRERGWEASSAPTPQAMEAWKEELAGLDHALSSGWAF